MRSTYTSQSISYACLLMTSIRPAIMQEAQVILEGFPGFKLHIKDERL